MLYDTEIGSLTVESGPSLTPVATSDVKTQLRLDQSHYDDLVESLVKSVRHYVETVCRTTLITTTYKLYFQHFPIAGEIELRRPPVQSLDSVEYIDQNGDTQTLSSDDYYSTLNGERPRFRPKTTWPATHLDMYDTVTVTYTAGYGDSQTDVPEHIRQVITAIVADAFEFPAMQNDLNALNQNKTVERMLWSIKRPTIV